MSGDWLADAVLYEIYPQSFADANGDGIGDLRGVIDHLDHIASLGVDVIWFNPCFVSPFVDAGYDVADYLTIAPRYGTNDDMVELVVKARERGIRVLLDLVAGHTSIEHPWFQAELAATEPHPDGDRYVWCAEPPHRDTSGDLPGTAAWVRSPGPRPGWYLKNFYDAQPALNFGWAQLPADEPWRDAVDAPGPRRNAAALKDILDFWLRRGVAGFRVDMAFSLVKDDPDKAATVALWRETRAWLDATHPDAALIPEGREQAAPRVPRRLLPRDPRRAREPVRQRLRGHPALAGAARTVLRRLGCGQHRGVPGPNPAYNRRHQRGKYGDRRRLRLRGAGPAVTRVLP